jgi:hypothetical protein
MKKTLLALVFTITPVHASEAKMSVEHPIQLGQVNLIDANVIVALRAENNNLKDLVYELAGALDDALMVGANRDLLNRARKVLEQTR